MYYTLYGERQWTAATQSTECLAGIGFQILPHWILPAFLIGGHYRIYFKDEETEALKMFAILPSYFFKWRIQNSESSFLISKNKSYQIVRLSVSESLKQDFWVTPITIQLILWWKGRGSWRNFCLFKAQ